MTQEEICVVCTAPEPDPMKLQVCGNCYGVFHLNPTQGPGKDCGTVGFGDEENPALRFVCNNCLYPAAAAARTPLVASTLAAMPTDASPARRVIHAPRRAGTRRFRRIDDRS